MSKVPEDNLRSGYHARITAMMLWRLADFLLAEHFKLAALGEQFANEEAVRKLQKDAQAARELGNRYWEAK